MLKKIESFVKKEDLFRKNDTLVVALSGGVDSSVLLDVLLKLDYKIVIAHINHHKRNESEIEEKYIKEYATNNNIACEVLDYYHTGKGNFHNDAHKARYAFYKSVCQKYKTNVLVTAHHLDDNLETIIMNMMMGSNLYGYGGISPKAIINDITVARPFLCLSKTDILEYATTNNIKYFEDSSNSENNYMRNRIRHNIIPEMKNECDDILDKSYSFSKQLKNSFDYIRKESEKYLFENNYILQVKQYQKMHTALRLDIISLLFERINLEKTEKMISKIDDMIFSDKPQQEITLSKGYIFLKRYDVAYITNDKPLINEETYKLDLESSIDVSERLRFHLTTKLCNSSAKYIKLCYNRLSLPLIVRYRCDEDTIEMTYGHKKIKDLFIDLKLTKEERNMTPIITDSQNKILWVYDFAKSKDVYDQKESGDIYLICEEKHGE